MSRKVREVAAEEFREHLFALIEEVNETGEMIVVTKDGEALVKVTPIGSIPSLRGSILHQGDVISPVIALSDEE